jgi:hypothetical protein
VDSCHPSVMPPKDLDPTGEFDIDHDPIGDRELVSG